MTYFQTLLWSTPAITNNAIISPAYDQSCLRPALHCMQGHAAQVLRLPLATFDKWEAGQVRPQTSQGELP